MTLPAKRPRPARYEDILALPEHLVGEIVDGELVVSPRPAPAHARAASSLGMGIGRPFDHGQDGPGGWVILDEPELHLAEHVLVPDLAGWRSERMPALPTTAWFDLAPDWLCEVLSPATALVDRTHKQEIYRAHRVPWLWFVDPAARTVEVLRNAENGWLLIGTSGGNTEARMPPFDAVPLDLAKLWELTPLPAP
ncbi:MAG: Uma2 family endonuclease [Polyangia bacterium]|jgi:Uma2 family endonuclease